MDVVGNLVGIILGTAILAAVSAVILLALLWLILKLLRQVRVLAEEVRGNGRRVSGLSKVVREHTGPIPAQQAELAAQRPPAPAPERSGATVWNADTDPQPQWAPAPAPVRGPSTNPLGVIPAQQAQAPRGRHARDDA